MRAGSCATLLLVALAGGLILVAFAASLIAQVIAEAGKSLSHALGLEGVAAAAATVVEVAGGFFSASWRSPSSTWSSRGSKHHLEPYGRALL